MKINTDTIIKELKSYKEISKKSYYRIAKEIGGITNGCMGHWITGRRKPNGANVLKIIVYLSKKNIQIY